MDKNSKIVEVFVLRFFITLVLYMANINNWLKILLILSLDSIKTFAFIGLFKPGEKAENQIYQYYDKILDIFGYYLTYFIISNNKLLAEREIQILKYVLFYRTIGDLIYLLTGNRTVLFYFVDVFKELLITFYLFKPNSTCYYIGIVLSIVVKLIVEYRLHISKKGINIFEPNKK